MEDSFKESYQHIQALQEKLGVKISKPEIFFTACVHRSYQNEINKKIPNNERLEFLGDSVLSTVVSEFLYEKFPEFNEGELSFAKSKIVEASICAACVRQLGLESFLFLGKGEALNLGKGRDTIVADFFEALVGALFCDVGFFETKEFLLKNFSKYWIDLGLQKEENEKVNLQEFCQKKFQEIPEYRLISEQGPDHDKQFIVAVFIQGRQLGDGVGASKKQAQQNAAKAAMKALKDEVENEN
jgi:ribonuclease-3